MKTRVAIAAVLLSMTSMVRADEADRARFHWIMNCQGCHKPDASGSADGAPSMSGQMGRFLSVPGGRQYLSRVPGVAFAPLSDADLADLLNWCLRTFDPQNVPADFLPYTAEEVGPLRGKPLVSDARDTRKQLTASFKAP